MSVSPDHPRRAGFLQRLRSSALLPLLAATSAYGAITIVMVQPFVTLANVSVASFEGDARLLIWALAWDAHALLMRVPLFDANMFYPEPGALAWAEHYLGIALFALPFEALTGNPVLAYWCVWLLAFPLNAAAMWVLARRVTGDRLAAFAAGLVFAFCFFRMHHAPGHLQLLWTWAMPLVPVALERWFTEPTPRRTAFLTALVLVQALTSWYTAVMTALLATIAALAFMPGRRLTTRHVVHAVVALAAAAIVIAWLARPYFALQPGPLAETANNSADIVAYLIPPENTWLGQLVLAYTTLQPRWIWGEQTLYIGAATATLSLIGVSALCRRRPGDASRVTLAVLGTGILAFALSFGPSSSGWSPFDVFARLWGMALLRSPARFALLGMMALALLTAIGVQWLRQWKHGGVVVVGLCLLMLGESFVVQLPGGRPEPFLIPAVYRHLATLPRGAVVSLPTYDGAPDAFREADYLLYSTAHWFPIVNGYGRQAPPAHRELIQTLATFPSTGSVARMRSIGVRYVVVHTERAHELRDRVGEALQLENVRLLASFENGDRLFEVH